MNAPWMDRAPTREEVEAHAAAHGASYRGVADGTRLGLWMVKALPGGISQAALLRYTDGSREGVEFLEAYVAQLWWRPLLLPCAYRWLPLTADGLPVALVTELDAVRGALVRVHELAATLNNRAPHGRGCQRSTRCTCGLAAISEELFADELLALLEVTK